MFDKSAFFAGFLVCATPMVAEPMSGAEFEDFVTGQTLTFAEDGQVYGIEQYLPNRRVRWAFMGDQCRDGFWYEEAGGQICFLYEDLEGPQCWIFSRDGGRLTAQFQGDGGRELYEAQRSAEPLRCLGSLIEAPDGATDFSPSQPAASVGPAARGWCCVEIVETGPVGSAQRLRRPYS